MYATSKPKRGLGPARTRDSRTQSSENSTRTAAQLEYAARSPEGIPIAKARRKVEVLAPNGVTSHHLTHADAHFKVAAGTASWIGSNYKTIQLIDQRVLARGVCGFDTEWRVKRSGIYGPTVWQMDTTIAVRV